MKAAVWNEKGTFDIVDRVKPNVQPDWALVAVDACGICGSDLHCFRVPGGAPPGDPQPGHEVAGFVAQVGEEVTLEVGGLVAFEPLTSCGSCANCRAGQFSQCLDHRFFGYGLPGGMAEYLAVPARLLHQLPLGFSTKVAAMAEPFAVSVRGARRGGVSMGDRVVILGAGTIGLFSIPAVRAAGAGEIFITARHPHQAKCARHLGATQVFSDTDDMLATLGQNTADVVIEAVGGHAETLLDAAKAARPGGTVVVLGVFAGPNPFENPTPICGFLRELTFVGSLGYAHDGYKSDFALTVELMVNLEETLAPLVTHEFTLGEINNAFTAASDKSTGSIKVQVRPNSV